MSRYGYIKDETPVDPNKGPQPMRHGADDALKDLQKYGGIPETGIIDDATIEVSKWSTISQQTVWVEAADPSVWEKEWTMRGP